MKKMIVAFSASIIMLFGCQKKIPEPENKIIPMESVVYYGQDVIETTGNALVEKWHVQHFVKGNDLFIECFVKGMSFSQSASRKTRASIVLYVDGKKSKEIGTAAFIVKGLSEGKHTISLYLYNGTERNFISKKEFIVHIKNSL
jgi:hypothetical protein